MIIIKNIKKKIDFDILNENLELYMFNINQNIHSCTKKYFLGKFFKLSIDSFSKL